MMRRALMEILNAERWRDLIGDSRVEFSEEDEDAFAVRMGQALRVVLGGDLPPNIASRSGKRRRLEGYLALAELLKSKHEDRQSPKR